MRLERLFIQHFTNLETLDLVLHEEVNLLQGRNAQGKTNFLDAIHVLSRATSCRGVKDRELIRWGESFFRIKGRFERDGDTRDLAIAFTPGKKNILVDENRIDTMDALYGALPVVLFSPDDLSLVKGGPEERRRFLDEELCQSDRGYTHELYRYKKILQQRNAALRQSAHGSAPSMLDVYDEQLARHGLALLHARRRMLDTIRPLMRLAHRQMTEGAEEIDLGYQPGFPGGGEPADEEDYRARLEQTRRDDLMRGYTTAGPHRDDVSVLLNGRELKRFGSQGQQRTAALCLKMAEVRYLQTVHGSSPLLLLDDVLSELDTVRRRGLLSLMGRDVQTFITCTDVEDIGDLGRTEMAVFTVDGGRIGRSPA